MADWDPEQKTEQPTPHRREEARRRGHVPRSRDLTVSLALLGGFLALRFVGPGLAEYVQNGVRELLLGVSGQAEMTQETVVDIAAATGTSLALLVLPFVAMTTLVVAAAGGLQGGGTPHFSALAPDLARIDPLEGLRRLLGIRSLARGLLALAKIALVVWFLVSALESLVGASGPGALLESSSWKDGLQAFWELATSAGLSIALCLVGLGIVEYGFQRWQHERDLRMTRAEVIEELARLEGSKDWDRARSRLASDRREKGSR